MQRTEESARVRTRATRSALRVVSVAAAILAWSAPAFAGPVEQMVEIAYPPGKSDTLAVRYLNGGGGLFLSTDSGKTWAMQCSSALVAAGGKANGPLAVLPDKTLLLLSSGGVLHADANGCGFKVESADLTKTVVDFVANPMNPMEMIGVTSNPSGVSGLVKRSADGTWAKIGVEDAPLPVSIKAAVHEGAVRVYEAAVKMSAADPNASAAYALRVSDNLGQSWQEYPLDADIGTPRIRAIDPMNSQRLLIVIDRTTSTDSILLSKDGGKTSSKYLEVDDFGGVTFAPDGRVWIGDLGKTSGTSMTRGLYAAANVDAMPARLPMAMYPVQCLGWAADTNTLFACQRFWVGTVDLQSGEFTTKLRFSEVPKFVSCPGEDPAPACKTQLCLDYCGPGHFAVAPVCSAYDEPTCGKPVAAMEGGGSGGSGGTGGSAAGSGAAGTGGSAAGTGSEAAGSLAAGTGAAGMSAAGTGSAGSTTSGSGSGASGTGTTKKSSGCAVQPGERSDLAGAWLVAAALAWFVTQRRLRARGVR